MVIHKPDPERDEYTRPIRSSRCPTAGNRPRPIPTRDEMRARSHRLDLLLGRLRDVGRPNSQAVCSRCRRWNSAAFRS